MANPSIPSKPGHASSATGSSSSRATAPVIRWQPGWRELDLVIGLAIEASGAQTLLDPAAFGAHPRAGIGLADVAVEGSADSDRIFAGVGSLIDGAGGGDALFTSDSQGGNRLVGGEGADSFFLRTGVDQIIGGQLFFGAAAFALDPFTALVDRERDAFLIDSSSPGSGGALQIRDFEPGVDLLLVDGIAPTGDWSAQRQRLQELNVLVNAAPELQAGPLVINLRSGVEISQDLAAIAVDRDGDALQLLKLSGPEWVTTSGTVLRATVPAGLSEEQVASTPLLLGFSDGQAIASVPARLAIQPAPVRVELSNAVTALAENTSTGSPIKLADLAIIGTGLAGPVISLSGADAASFALSGNALLLRPGTNLDFETQPSYAVTLSASDPSLPGSTVATAAFSLAVTDVNEPPVSNGIASLIASENDSTLSVDLLAAFTDPDRGDRTLAYSVSLNSNPQLLNTAIDPLTGRLRLSLAPARSGTARITVQASDSQGQSASSAFSVSVLPLDANNDGIPDRTQANLIPVATPNQEVVTFAAEAGGVVPVIGATANPDPGSSPAGVQFPAGFFALTYEGLAPGAAAKLEVFLPRGTTTNSYWKYGPTTPGGASEWYDFSFDPVSGTGATFEDLNGDGQTDITLHFIDGQRGDDDLLANGRISDPGAPAFTPPTRPAPGTPGVVPQPQPGGPSRIRATDRRDRLTGTAAVDTFVFQGVQSPSGKRRLRFDTITNFEPQDRIAIRDYDARPLGSTALERVRKDQGRADALREQMVDRVLGADFKGQTIAALEIRGFDGTFLAVNGGRRKVEGGRPGFDRRDLLIWLEGYDLERQGPVLLA